MQFNSQRHRQRYWFQFWDDIAPTCDADTLVDILRDWFKDKELLFFRVKTLGGEFRPLGEVILPGKTIDSSTIFDGADGTNVLDSGYHAETMELIVALGVADNLELVERNSHFESALVKEYHEWALDEYLESPDLAKLGKKPQKQKLDFLDAKFVRPIDPIKTLRGVAAIAFTNALLEFARSEDFWEFGHITVRGRYPVDSFESMPLWAIKTYGWIETSRGNKRTRDAVGSSLNAWAPFFPVAHLVDSDCELLELEDSLDSIGSKQWHDALIASLEFTGDEIDLANFYSVAAAYWNDVPTLIRCRRNNDWTRAATSDVCALVDSEVKPGNESKTDAPYIIVESQKVADRLIEKWGLLASDDSEVGFISLTDAIRAVDKFPALREAADFPHNITLQPCQELWLEKKDTDLGMSRRSVGCIFRIQCLFVVGLEDSKILDRLAREFPTIDETIIRRCIEELKSSRLESQVHEVRAAESVEEKLIICIGNDRLRAGIPSRHLLLIDKNSSLEVARLAHVVHGIDILRYHRTDLAEKGFRPPSRWGGHPAAIEFVRNLGFPEEFAGLGTDSRSPWEDIIGPVTLPALHDYQERMRDRIGEFLRADSPGRGVLSLPTGSGKTRVAVESIIDWIRDWAPKNPSVLWIAQNDELCEQCVESITQAWRCLGPRSVTARISRLWGATNDRIRERKASPSFIVATYQSLRYRLAEPEFDWVFSPGLVVVDEAHGAIAPSFTQILNRLGLDQKATKIPLIGLTATPFRGDNDERGTYRLAFRFGFTRFDLGDEDADVLFRSLQQKGVLAFADHELLHGDEIKLSPAELDQLNKFNEPSAVTLDRLASSELRNKSILDHIARQPVDWNILLFAATVQHAEDLAVRLNLHGISSAAISSNTLMAQRRYAIDSFKAGRIRVLTNYGVLTTGFDAPKVRAVYVARPVYSPVLYQQMIGRGLRGEKNGGYERCLVVNVEDNFSQYGEALAFRRFEYLWSPFANANLVKGIGPYDIDRG